MKRYIEDASNKEIELYADLAGEKHIESILEALEKEPLGVSLMQLAWTAGPLTFIALQGGYWLGYGKTAPFSLFTYFASYTFIAGTVGLFVKIIYKAHQNRAYEATKKNYLIANDLTFLLYKSFLDYRIGNLSPQERQIESSLVLLSNTHALPESIALGVQELSNNVKLAELSKTIEFFRQAGLHTRAKEIIDQNEILKQDSVLKLINAPSESSYLLKMRLEGRAPTLKEGLERTDGFLLRINQACEENNPSVMRLKDAEEFLILLFELLNGRKIDILSFSYTGNKKLRQSARSLEKARASYRSARAALHSIIDEMYSLLIHHDLITDVKDYDARIKCEQIYMAINNAFTSLQIPVEKLKVNGEYKLIKNISIILKRYTQLYNKYELTLFYQKKLTKAIKHWRQMSEGLSSRKTRFRYGKGKRGLRINRQVISLNDEVKLKFSDSVVTMLQSFWAQHVSINNLSELAIKKLTISLAKQTSAFIRISNPIIQYGIESSRATNLGALDQGSSVESRTFWTAAMVKETQYHLQSSAEKLAKVLLFEYDLNLDDAAIEFLKQKFGANESNLRKFIEEKNQSDSILFKLLPMEVVAPPRKWAKILKGAGKLR